MTDDIPLFKGEAMLLRWSDSSSGGKTVTFALGIDEAPEVHPFRGLGTGKMGQKFMLVCVPITDEGRPSFPEATQAAIGSVGSVDAPALASGKARGGLARAAALTPERRSEIASIAAKKRWGDLSLPQQIGIRCSDPAFQTWASMQEGMSATGADAAAQYVRHTCGVKSRAEIQPGTAAAVLWHTLLTQFEMETGQIAERRNE